MLSEIREARADRDNQPCSREIHHSLHATDPLCEDAFVALGSLGDWIVNFPSRYISWEGGHALKRCEERGKAPLDVEDVIRNSTSVGKRADGRFNIDGSIGGEVTRVVVAEVRSDAIVVVTVFGRGERCS